MAEEFKTQIETKIDSAVDKAAQSPDWQQKAELEKFTQRVEDLRTKLKESILQDDVLDEDEITNEEWEEIFDSLPKELLEEFKLMWFKDLRDFVLFGEQLNESQRKLFDFEVPDQLAVENLAGIDAQLNQFAVDISNLGGYRRDFNEAEAIQHAEAFKEKLADLNIKANELGRNTPQDKDKRLAKQVADIALHLYFDLEKFISGNFFQQLKYDPVQTEGIEEHDVRSKYLKYGIKKHETQQFIEKGIPESLVADYHKAGLLQEDLYDFVEQYVPVQVAQDFLDHFTAEEKARLSYNITNDDVAEILSQISNRPSAPQSGIQPDYIDMDFVADYIRRDFRDGNSVDRDLLGRYYPELLASYEVPSRDDPTKKETKYFIPLNEIQLVFNKMEGSTHEEKLSRYQAYKDIGLRIEEILVANAIPELSPERIQAQVDESQGIFKADDVYRIHVDGLDPDELKQFYQALPDDEDRSSYQFARIKKELPNTPIGEVLPFLPLMAGRDFNIGESMAYFLDNNISPTTIQEYQNAGLSELGEVESVMKAGISLEYLKGLNAIGMKEIDFYRLKSWHEEGLKPKQIKPFYDLAFSGRADHEILWTENIKKYFKVVDSEEKHNHFLSLLDAEVSVSDALTAVEKNISVEDIQAAKKYELGVDLASAFKAHNITEFIPIIEAQEGYVNVKYRLEKLIPLLEAGADRDEAKEMIRRDFDLHLAVDVQKAGENWRDYLPYKDFLGFNNFQAIQTMRLLQISPENLKRYCKQYPSGKYEFDNHQIDAVVLSEYDRGNLPEESRQFLEKYNLSFPSRYPASILTQMQSDYESPERQGKPTAILITGKNDWNGAFEGSKPYEDLLQGYNVYIYEVSSEDDFIETVKAFGGEQKDAGRKIDLMVIGGHGYQGGINFSEVRGEQSELDIGDSDDLKGLDQFLNPNGRIVLRSCSTGKGGANANNIASTISEAFGGVKVLAPSVPTKIKSFRYDEDGKVIGVEYFDEGIEEEISLPR